MKLKYSFESVDMGDEIILVPVGEGANEVKGVIKLNKEGLEIVELLKNNITKDQIVKLLSAKYENDWHTLSGWVDKVIYSLTAAGLVDYS